MSIEFEEFPKIARLNREIVVTEKLDGTNSQILIGKLSELQPSVPPALAIQGDLVMLAGSRNRYVTPTDDNYGFAKWVMSHAEELFALGEGRHFGEWWGGGIQTGYGLAKDDKRFSLFNTTRWGAAESRPACCGIVPVLYQGKFSEVSIEQALNTLRDEGSKASPGFMKPEGIVVFHVHSNQMFKVTLKNDGLPKSLVKD